jgi:hypothetical protein
MSTRSARERSSVILLVLALAACGDDAPPAAPVELISWTSADRYRVSELTAGETVGSDTEAVDRVVFTPEPLTGFFDPDLSELRLEVTHAHGTRTMRTGDGATFTAGVPSRARIVADGTGEWEIETTCEEAVSAPMPRMGEDGVGHYEDGAVFWESCALTLHHGPDLEYLLRLEVRGDGRLEASASSGAVTVRSRR